MSSDSDEKCLVCEKAGRTSNIFTTYNMRKEKEELYVEVIKNCFNIEIAPDCGLNALCNNCGMKLKKAYNFRHEILLAIEKLISAQVTDTNDKQYSEVEYLEDIPFQPVYDIEEVLNPETSQIAYALDEICHDKEIIDNNDNDDNFLMRVDNDAIVDKVLFNESNDNVGELIENDEMVIVKDSDAIPADVDVLDKPIDNYTVDILNGDLEPGEIRVIDNVTGHYLIDAKNEVIVDNRKVVIKSKGKMTLRKNKESPGKIKAGPVVEDILVNVVGVDDELNGNGIVINSDADEKCVNGNKKKKVKTVFDEPIILDGKLEDLVGRKRRASKRIARTSKTDEISLLAQICTKQPNPEEYIVSNAAKEVKEQTVKEETSKEEQTNVKEIDEVKCESKVKKTRKRTKKTVEKKEAEVKENVSDNVEETKAKKPKRQKREKKPKKEKENPAAVPFSLQPNQTDCDFCKAKFITTRALSIHMNTHYPAYVCGECGTEAASKDRLRQHMKVHDKGPFICKVCDKEFATANTRNAHTWRVHSTRDPFKCRHCPSRFPTYLQRLRHAQAAHAQAPRYACPACPAAFHYAALRTKHMRTMHLDQRPHACDLCPSAFARARELAGHRASKHGQGAKPYRCPTCGASFFFRTALRYHISQHRRNFECKQCDQKFATSAELDSHTQIHEHADNMAINLDFVTSLHLDALADDYALIDPSYLDLNDL